MLLAYPQIRNFKPRAPIMVTPPVELLTEAVNEQEAVVEREDSNAPGATPDVDDQSGFKVETGRTRGGKDFVRVYGTREEAEEVRKGYQTEGKEPGPVNKDKYRQGVWYFYI